MIDIDYGIHDMVSDVLIVAGLGTVGYGLYTLIGKSAAIIWGGVWLFLFGLGYHYENVEQ